MKITIAGIGPGDQRFVLPLVQHAISEATVIIGYDYYFQFINTFIAPDTEKIAMPLGKEEERGAVAIEKAKLGHRVLVIGSGDASIYSMASIVYEMVSKEPDQDIELETLPGISAFLAAGSKLGAPLGHDFCCISLSDLMTPWNTIEKRIKAAAIGDFVTSLYNPRSKKRYWQLGRLQAIFLEERDTKTPVAIVRQVTRTDEEIKITTLGEFNPEEVDMFSLVMIGNSQTYRHGNYLITPRGYLNRKPHTGEEIQQESFRIVTDQIKELPFHNADKWAITRIIHTTGVFDDHQWYQATDQCIEKWHHYLSNGGEIVTDVTMVKAGITKKFIKQFDTKVHCFLNDEDVIDLAKEKNITRSQAGIRKGIERYPKALFVIGNAPTALMELTDELQYNHHFSPAGIIGVPVGFVNVIESKEQLSQSRAEHVIINGNRGGSNVAAAIVNAAYTLDQARDYFNDVMNHSHHLALDK